MTKKKCPYCGNNPVNHRMSYFFETLGTYMTGYDQFILNTRAGKLAGSLADGFQKFMLRLLVAIGIGRWNTDPEKAFSDRGKVLWYEAIDRGIPMKSLLLYGAPIDMYKAKVNGKNILFQGLPRKERKKIETWLDDKALLKKYFKQQSIPVPEGESVTKLEEALALFHRLEKPLIVKPRSGSRGRHTTTYIYTEEDMKKAFAVAKQLSKFVVVEEHLFGSVYRGTVIGGELVGVLRGDPPRITGNGKSNVRELIEEKNKNRHPHVSEYVITDMTEEFLERNGYTLNSIIPEGKAVDLSEKIGVSYGGSSKELYDETHPKIKEVLLRAGRAVNDDLVGFDFIIPDPTSDPDTQKWGIIECNTLPFINLHHDPIEGAPRNAAKYVWDLWEKN